MMFIGNRHCPHCGAAAATAAASTLAGLKCPRCKVEMSSISLGGEAMRECEHCSGLWLDVVAFERICTSREQQSSVLGVASTVPGHAVDLSAEPIKVSYIPCPQCGQLMNRMNFAHCSGVVVDVCRGHGTWFDRDELRQIVEFIRAGGLELARQKEKRVIQLEREELERDRFVTTRVMIGGSSSDDERIGGISAAGSLLRFLLE
jgi:Zn-finger nucleic acid-binding protein